MANLIRQMGHVTLGVHDPAASAADLADIVGLRVAARHADEVLLTSNHRRFELALRQSPQVGALAVGLEAVSTEAVAEIARRVRAEGLDIIADRSLHSAIGAAVRFRCPGGAILEVHAPIPRGGNGQAFGHTPRPRRIEHVNIFVPDVRATGDCLRDVLGMKLSDAAGENLFAWYRAEDGFHHTVALGPGACKLHHYAFDLHAMGDLVAIADRLAAKQRALIWGPGRHGAGGNVFTYYVDLDGCVVENSIEMMRVDHEATYEAGHWGIGAGTSGRWINLWGNGPPADFGEPGLPFV